MKLDAEFEVVEMDQVVHASESYVQNPTWGLNRLDQCDLPLSGSTFQKLSATDVRVYILDTGINGSHQEFQGMIGTDDGTCHFTPMTMSQPSSHSDGPGKSVKMDAPLVKAI